MKTKNKLVLIFTFSFLSLVFFNGMEVVGQINASNPIAFAQQKVLYVQIPNHTIRHVRTQFAGAQKVAMYQMHESGKYVFYLRSQDETQIPLAEQEILGKFPDAIVQLKTKHQADLIFKELDKKTGN